MFNINYILYIEFIEEQPYIYTSVCLQINPNATTCVCPFLRQTRKKVLLCWVCFCFLSHHHIMHTTHTLLILIILQFTITILQLQFRFFESLSLSFSAKLATPNRSYVGECFIVQVIGSNFI